MKSNHCILVFVLALAACAHSPTALEQKTLEPVLSAWAEYGPDSQLQARAIVTLSECPKLIVDDHKSLTEVAMAPRAPSTKEFPYLVCQGPLSKTASAASVLGQQIPLAKNEVNKIVVIGDTGCRIKVSERKGFVVQSCGSAIEWPFKTVIESAAKFNPDLVIHVGDYHYRESRCPEGNPNCAKIGDPSTSGDLWASWNEDFLTPAVALLKKAPWIFVRGNHELCPRGGVGWNTILSPYPFSSPCADNRPPYAVKVAGQRFLIADVADDANEKPSFKKLSAFLEGNDFAWLLLHRPFLTLGADNEAKEKVSLPKKLQQPGVINLVMTGHVHTSSINQFNDSRPPEVISGNGGTKLDVRSFKGMEGITATEFKDFGFLELTRKTAEEWKMDVVDRDGKPVWLCDLIQARKKQTKVVCKPARS